MTSVNPSDQSAQLTETLARQGLAADPERSAWVSANAGTGKTKVLTDRVIRLMLAGTEPEKILCLTFTKTAAAEMSIRLFERLGKWTALDDAALIKELQKLEGVDIDPEQLSPARRLFARALETPGGLKIQTIHGFCQSVLERFPLEARIAPGFQVLDDTSARLLLRDAELSLYRQGVDGGPLQAPLSRLAARYDAPGFSDLLRQLLGQRSKIRELFERVDGLAGLEADLRRRLELPASGGPDELVSRSLDEIERRRIDLEEAVSALSAGSKTDQKIAGTLDALLAGALAAETYNDYEALFLTAEGQPRARLMTKKVAEEFPHLHEVLTQEQERVFALRQEMRRLVALQVTLDVLETGDAFIENYTRGKEARALLDYDDLIEKTVDLLHVDGGALWVHYKLDGGIEHILVDEAQDTSPGQWQVIEALAADFFTGRSAFEEDAEIARTIFAVGDEKQSIYSFQGADPKEFGRKREEFRGRTLEAGGAFSDLDLILSFRSTSEVLNAVDAVFADAARGAGLTSSGPVPGHEAHRASEPGLVELWPVVKPEETDDTDPWDAPLDRVARSAPRAVVAAQIAEQIDHWLKTREPVIRGDRPIEPGDILILVQRRNSFVDEMIRALKLKNIPVAGRDRMVLTEQIVVQDLIALGDFALLPEDDLTLAVVLRSPFVGLPEEALLDLGSQRKGTLWDALRARASEPAFAPAAAFLGEVLARVEVVRPFEFFEEALGGSDTLGTSGRERLLTRLGPEATDPIEEFLTLALHFEQLEPPSLQGFLGYMRSDQSEIKRDFDAEPREVRIMTVHGAKGLEGRIVFLPDTCVLASARGDGPLLRLGEGEEERLLFAMPRAEADAGSLDLREELAQSRLAEQRRLLYVAMTRARDRLYITGYETTRERPDGCWYSMMEEGLSPIMHEAERFDDVPVLRLDRAEVGDFSPPVAERRLNDLLDAPALPEWALQKVSPEPPPRRLAPSQLSLELGDDGGQGIEPPVLSPLAAAGKDRFKRGLAVHRLLELLPPLPVEAREGAAMAFLTDPAREIAEGEATSIAAEVLAVLAHPEFSDIFGPESLAEAPVAGHLPGSDIHLGGSIDRLVIADDKVLIVDFKTNRPPPLEVEKVAPVYIMQMAAYRALLQVLFPERPVRAALLWTDGPRLMELPGSLMDEAISRLQNRKG